MDCVEIASFEVTHRALVWPWVAIDPTRTRFAFATTERSIATRAFASGRVSEGTTFALPADLALPTEKAPDLGHRGSERGVHGFAIDPCGELLAVTGTIDGASVVVTLDANGEVRRTRVDALAGPDFVAHAVTFDRTGARLWLSAESGRETALISIDARTHALAGVVRSAPFPATAYHELYVHAQDDAVLLLAACGQDGTFARVAGWSDGPPVAIETALDQGAVSAGFVGFSSDGARVHLAEADELRTHAWPGLQTLSSVPFADEFVSSYSGAVIDSLIFVDGEIDRDDAPQDAVMMFDRSALKGALVSPPAPPGMWVGKLGANAIVTVEAKGDPARGRVLLVRKIAN